MLIRLESTGWALLARLLLMTLGFERALWVGDQMPRWIRARRSGSVPADGAFRLAGTCLGRSLARSQFLRARNNPHALVIGVKGGVSSFGAHAWIDPGECAPPGFVELRRIYR